LCSRFQFFPPSLRIAQLVDVSASGSSSSHAATPTVMNLRLAISFNIAFTSKAE